MKKLLTLGLLTLSLQLGACLSANMEDCCECLFVAGEISCSEPQEECVDQCYDLCSDVLACRCTAARRADCSAECGCDRGF